jgi:hypothetical protein
MTRTPNPGIGNPLLYPAEPRTQNEPETGHCVAFVSTCSGKLDTKRQNLAREVAGDCRPRSQQTLRGRGGPLERWVGIASDTFIFR